MARKPQDEAEIARLIERIEHSRGEVAAGVVRVREAFDWKARVRDSLQTHPKWWFGAALAAGVWVAGRLFRRPDKAPVAARRGMFGMLAVGAMSVAKTLARDWVLRESRRRLEEIARR